MAKQKKEIEVKKAEEKVGASALAVYDASEKYIRTYSAEAHGSEFHKLAEGFAKKIGGTVRKA